MNKQSLKKALIIVHDLVATALAVLVDVRRSGSTATLLDERLRLPADVPAALRLLCGRRLLVLRSSTVEVALRLAARSLQHRPRLDRPGADAAGGRLHAGLAAALRLLLLRQDRHRALLAGADVPARRAAARLPLHQIRPLAAHRSRARPRRRRSCSGAARDVEVVLRAIESGTVKKLQPQGHPLAPRRPIIGQSIRGVPVLGDIRDLERVVSDFHERGIAIRRLVATPSALAPEAQPDVLIARARRLGLLLSRVTSLGERHARGGARAARDRGPAAAPDRVRSTAPGWRRFITGKRVLVTGGGGSIGSEICARVRRLRGNATCWCSRTPSRRCTQSSKRPRCSSSDTAVRWRHRRRARPRAHPPDHAAISAPTWCSTPPL